MSTRTFLFCDDERRRILLFQSHLEQKLKRKLSETTGGTEWIVERAENYEDALNKSHTLEDDDIISLDSRLNRDMSEGERILARLRERNCRCFAIWHSSATGVPPWAEQCCFKMPGWSDFEIRAEEIADEYKRWQRIRDTVSCRQPNFAPAQNLTAIYSILKAMELFPNKRAEIQDGWRQANAEWQQQLWSKAWHEFQEEPKRDDERWRSLELPTFDDNGALKSGTLGLEQTDIPEAIKIIKSVLPR